MTRPITPFGLALRAWRHRQSFTQQALAEALGVSVWRVWSWERGLGHPDPTREAQVLAVLGVSEAEFFAILDATERTPRPWREVAYHGRRRPRHRGADAHGGAREDEELSPPTG